MAPWERSLTTPAHNFPRGASFEFSSFLFLISDKNLPQICYQKVAHRERINSHLMLTFHLEHSPGGCWCCWHIEHVFKTILHHSSIVKYTRGVPDKLLGFFIKTYLIMNDIYLHHGFSNVLELSWKVFFMANSNMCRQKCSSNLCELHTAISCALYYYQFLISL